MADFELDFVGPGARLALAASKRVEAALATAGFSVPFSTWADLAASAESMPDGTRSAVLALDSGTHSDPVAGVVPNPGVYEKQAAYTMPVRIADLDSQLAEASVAEAQQIIAGADNKLGRFIVAGAAGWSVAIMDRLAQIAGGWTDKGVLRSVKASFDRVSADDVALRSLSVTNSMSILGSSLRNLKGANAIWVAGLDSLGRFTARVRATDGVFEAGKGEFAELQVGSINGKPVGQIAGDASFSRPDFAATIEAIIVYGQSLSLGVNGSPPITTNAVGVALKWSNNTYSAFAPLSEPCTPEAGNVESPSSGLAAILQQMIEEENGLAPGAAGHSYQPFLFNPGQGGQPITMLNKGTARYAALISQLTTARNLAAAAGKSLRVRGVVWMQGEADYALGRTSADYKALLKQLRNDLDTDIKALIPDNPDVTMILSQPASHKYYQYQQEVGGTYPDAIYAKDANIAQVMLDLAQNEPHFSMSLAQYVGEYQSDTVHALNRSYRLFGGYHGRAYKRMFVDGAGQDIKSVFLQPTEVKVQGKIIEVKFDVPSPPLVIDAALTNLLAGRGFTLRNASGADVGALDVAVIEPTKIRIVSPVAVTAGFQLRHAIDGDLQTTGKFNGPRSNLRDSQGDDLLFDVNGVSVPLHNMAPIFSHTF